MPDFQIEIDIDPEIQRVKTELKQSVEEVTGRLLRAIAQDAPAEMQELMATSAPSGNPARGGGKHSAKGQPPAIVTRELFNSLSAIADGYESVQINMAAHAFYLDPVFEGAGDGGGYLNRPFIVEGIERALAKNLGDLRR